MFGKGRNKGGEPEALSLTKAEPADAVAKPADDLGRYPNEVDANPSHTRAQERALRAVSLVAIVAGLMCVALTMLIITILPLQKVYPYLVTFKDQSNQVVSIEPMDASAPGMLYATEDAVRDYVVQRHSFTPQQALMLQQWGPSSRLAARTAQEPLKKFADAVKEEISRMMSLGYVRTIDIKAVNRISADTWQVDFTTTDRLPTAGGTLTPQSMSVGQTPGVTTGPVAATPGAGGFGQTTAEVAPQMQNWVATLKVEFQPQRITYDKRLLNPLGFTVTDYSVTRSTR